MCTPEALYLVIKIKRLRQGQVQFQYKDFNIIKLANVYLLRQQLNIANKDLH